MNESCTSEDHKSYKEFCVIPIYVFTLSGNDIIPSQDVVEIGRYYVSNTIFDEFSAPVVIYYDLASPTDGTYPFSGILSCRNG
jgi:hypothetical protein